MDYKLALVFFMYFVPSTQAKLTEDEFRDFLENTYEKQANEICYNINMALFEYEIDINNNEKKKFAESTALEGANWTKDIWSRYFQDLCPNVYRDPLLKRQAHKLRILGDAALNKEKLTKLLRVIKTMTGIYGNAKVCPFSNKHCDIENEGLSLEPDLRGIMSKSTNYDELLYVWKAWRDATGAKMRDFYKTYVTLANEAAQANNFSDRGAFWRLNYEDNNFIQNVDDLWTEVQPLYTELHEYVSRKLKQRYGEKLDISDGLLPAHILGNLWADTWINIADLVTPFPNVSQMDVGSLFKEKDYSVLDMFKIADDFYQSLGLQPTAMSYDETAGAMLNKPRDGREVICHASAWQFCDKDTYRFRMCTEVSYLYFIIVHHEMGHIQYFMQYKDQPHTFREGANPGFHEAVGDTIALSVTTPDHLKRINLLKDYEESYEASINSLMMKALEKVAFLPYSLIIDKWRWDIFNGSVPHSKWNSRWWEYRKKYQKIKAPISRSDETDLDPAAKYHVAGDSQYIAYFVANILQFQFYESLCIAAGKYNTNNKAEPLHKCDFYESTAAGDKLKKALKLGSSKHWSETLKILTGRKKVSAKPLLKYFEPLYDFLKQENKKARKARKLKLRKEKSK